MGNGQPESDKRPMEGLQGGQFSHHRDSRPGAHDAGQLAADPVWGVRLFGEGAKISNIQLGVVLRRQTRRAMSARSS